MSKQREIKFRIWNEKLQGFTYMDFTTGEDVSGCMMKNVPKQQFTGLKDRNGKDIYEGDIVKCSIKCPHIVQYDESYARFSLTGIVGGYDWCRVEEIIGNIYENPKLLDE